MALTSGTKLGPYEIQSPVGAGGMGEVYRARDTRLDRTVAIKILPSHLSENAEAQQRFEREARAISSLNHPNICTLYDVGHQDGVYYLVMEFLEGQTLSDRLLKGPLPTEQLLKFGNDICEGLEKAHKGDVTHRDLKPSNIMLTKTGAKLMDFGLAKAATPIAPPSSSLTAATLRRPEGSQPLTAQGTLVGTFQYMSPEQVEGHEADGRSDIFALGAVLYEMATGKRAFEGKTTASVIAAVLAAEPQPISVIQPMSPPALDRVVKTCLAKDPDERFQNVHDVKLQLKWIAEGGSQAGAAAPVAVRRENRERVAWILGVCAVLAALALVVIHFRQPAAETRVVRFTISPPENGSFDFGSVGNPEISPDGRSVAFRAKVGGVSQLWVRQLDSFVARPLAGTEDAYGEFWSPDSRNLGFFARGKVKRVAAAGGPALTLCDVAEARGGSWSRQDVIIFAKYPGEIHRIPASGGTAEQITHLDAVRHDTTQRWPYFLPDGNHFLYMASAIGSAAEGNAFYLGSLDGKVNRILFYGSSPIAYGSGSLLYVVDRNVMARPFDAAKLEFTGEPVPVAEGVQFDPLFSNALFSVSENGVLLYGTGSASRLRTLTLMDDRGKLLSTIGSPAASLDVRVSPDGRRLAYAVIDTKNGKSDIWIHDIASGNRIPMSVEPGRNASPAWSRDGARIAYYSMRSGKHFVFVKSPNSMGVEEKLLEPAISALPEDWTPDSKSLILSDRDSATGKDRLVLLSADGKGEPTTILQVQGADVFEARLSTDGRWIAYATNESGKSEVYVSSFPKPVGRLQISLAGGEGAIWRQDGKELYFVDPDGKLWAADLRESNGSLQVVSRRNLFTLKTPSQSGTYDAFLDYDAFPDGKRFLINVPTTQDSPAPLSVVLNWPAELKK